MWLHHVSSRCDGKNSDDEMVILASTVSGSRLNHWLLSVVIHMCWERSTNTVFIYWILLLDSFERRPSDGTGSHPNKAPSVYDETGQLFRVSTMSHQINRSAQKQTASFQRTTPSSDKSRILSCGSWTGRKGRVTWQLHSPRDTPTTTKPPSEERQTHTASLGNYLLFWNDWW